VQIYLEIMSEEKGQWVIGSSTRYTESIESLREETCAWTHVHADCFNVRSATFLEDKVKLPSEAALLKVYAVDVFKSKKKIPDIMSKLKFPDLPRVERDEADGGFYLPQLIVVNVMIPLYSPSMLPIWKKEDGDTAHFVVYYVVDQNAYNGLKDEQTVAYRVLKEWLQVDPKDSEDYQNRGRLNAIPEILNVEEINLGLLRPVVLSNSAKPFLTGPKFHDYVKTEKYLEIDVDIHRYAYAARNVLDGLRVEIPKMVLRFGLVVEGRSEDELPEQVLAGIALKIDQNSAPSLE
jgi:hypothetical protein